MIKNDASLYGNDYDDPRIKAETYYTCNQCHKPTGWDTIEGIHQHLDKCLFDVNNHSCAMCKHLKIIQEAPYPRLRNALYDEDVFWVLGNFKSGYCLKDERGLLEEDFLRDNDCFEDGSDKDAVIGSTEEYDLFREISDRIDLEQIENNKEIEKELNERLQKIAKGEEE